VTVERLHARARAFGVSLPLYWLVRAILQPAFVLYLGMRRDGREHIPREGPVILAANHRSFLDPFLIACLPRLDRAIHYMAKRELFAVAPLAWLLNRLGAFPVRRGSGDPEAIATAKELLARSACVVIFPEGTRTRPGPLGRPRRGIGRLALETGATVVPVAVIGTDAVRRGWRLRPHRVRLRCGPPLRLPRVEEPSPQLVATATARVWAAVRREWEALGGESPGGDALDLPTERLAA
jgi:glycerol-3-phosphate dehydrogenase (NAD(P)+)